MKTVFLSGSRCISRLNEAMRARLQRVIDHDFRVIIGDANGADKALQTFLAQTGYQNVVVFCAGNRCRNNVGRWNVNKVSVATHLTGREFYTQKDKTMASKADYGLILWDGKSAGSINNVFELLKNHKAAVVYFSPEKTFYTIKRLQDAQNLLDHCDKQSISTIQKKIGLNAVIRQLENATQKAFGF